jgi:hypothetical protein
MLFHRMEAFFDGKAQAATLFGGPYYFAEQLGYRKIIDTTFMIGAMINGEPDMDDVRRYFQALRRAQCDIDLRPELYTHYYKMEFPERFHATMDTRRWGPGERIVFERYSKEVFEQSFEWIAQHEIFDAGTMGSGVYDQSVISLAGSSSLFDAFSSREPVSTSLENALIHHSAAIDRDGLTGYEIARAGQ